ncbi:hypothetical protein ACQPZK_05930 [Micromonospora sp. CA-249363]|uniref:hypothetical protein n=1 Tax=Micromonospora sp. CA-249363 TaxID=3239963 RepID=UPI003D90C1CB
MIFPSGAVERERERILRAERPHAVKLPPEQLSPGEVAVALETGSTLADRDAKHAGRLLKAEQKLISTAKMQQVAYQQLKEVSSNRRRAGYPRHLLVSPDRSEPEAGAGTRFGKHFDPHWPLVAAWVLSLVEVLFVVVEVVFWYQVFNDDVEPDAGLFDAERMSAILLAVFIPVVGVWVARTVGKLGHRWVAGYRGVQRSAITGTVLSGVAGVLAIVAIAWLVYERFSPDEQTFASISVPAVPMALVFVLVLLIDMVARTFLTSEIWAQSTVRARHFNRKAKRLLARNRAQEDAWVALRSAVDVALDRSERVGAVGGLLVLDERAAGGRGGQPLVGATERAAHATAVGPGLALPDPTQQRLFGAPVALAPLRTISSAINSLAYWRPLTGKEVDDLITELRFEFHGMPKPDAAAAPPTANGTGPTANGTGPTYPEPDAGMLDHRESGA